MLYKIILGGIQRNCSVPTDSIKSMTDKLSLSTDDSKMWMSSIDLKMGREKTAVFFMLHKCPFTQVN